MKVNPRIFSLLILLFAAVTIIDIAQADVCLKNLAPVKNGKVNLKKATKLVEDGANCPSAYHKIVDVLNMIGPQGPAGEDGADGVSGFEIVRTIGPTLNVPAAGLAAAFAECPSGKVAVGGGCAIDNNSFKLIAHILNSTDDPHEWLCAYISTSGVAQNAAVTAWAHCASVDP